MKGSNIVVSDLTDKNYVSLDENRLVAEGAKALYEAENDTIIVTHQEGQDMRTPVGIVTVRDMIFRVVAQSKGAFKITLKDIMSCPIISISENSGIDESVRLMKKNNINRLVVLNEKSELVGMLSIEKVAKTMKVGKENASNMNI